jgi:hypothetical protein
MKFRVWFTILLTPLLLLGLLSGGAVADEPTTVLEGGAPASPAGIEAVASRYTFASSAGTYTEISGGTVHGTASNDDNSFNAIDLGFTFLYDGIPYTQVSIQSNGFIAMGPTVASSYTPSAPARPTTSSPPWGATSRATGRPPNCGP